MSGDTLTAAAHYVYGRIMAKTFLIKNTFPRGTACWEIPADTEKDALITLLKSALHLHTDCEITVTETANGGNSEQRTPL